METHPAHIAARTPRRSSTSTGFLATGAGFWGMTRVAAVGLIRAVPAPAVPATHRAPAFPSRAALSIS